MRLRLPSVLPRPPASGPAWSTPSHTTTGPAQSDEAAAPGRAEPPRVGHAESPIPRGTFTDLARPRPLWSERVTTTTRNGETPQTPSVRANPLAAHVLRQATVQTARPAPSQPPPSQRAKELNLNPPWWTPYAPPPKVAAVEARFGVPPGSFVRMDDVMNFLGSDAGAPFRTRLHAALKADGAQFGGPMESMRRGPRTTLPERIDAYFDYMKFNGELRRRLSDQEIRLLMPSALTCALNFIADDCGRVSVGAALDGAGPHASLLAELFLAMEHGARAFPSTRVGMKFRYLPSGVAERVAKSARPNDVDDRMGAFWKLVDELGSSGALRGWHVVERGHMNASTEALLRALLVSGGDRGSVLGKSYSAHPDVLHRAHALGWSVSEAELQDHTLEADDFRNGISSFIADVATHDRVLMLDDGYEGNSFVQYLMEQRRFRRPDDPMSLVTVEQTERGRSVQRELHANLGIEMKLPVVNMAGSSLKKTYESPAIGEAVAFQIEHDLWEAHPNLSITPKEATILGFGAVGSATAARLRARGYTVFVYDIDPAKMKAAADAGYDVGGFPTGAVPSDPARLETAHAAARDRVLAHGHLLVGCAPCECLKRSEYGKLPQHAVLANAGSGYTTLGEGAAASDAKESVAEAKGMGFGDLAAADERGVNIDGDLRLGLKGLVSYKDIPRAGDLLVDPQERVDDNGYRSTKFAGLDIRTGDVASRDRNFHRVARDPDGGERLVLRNGGVVNLRFDLPPEYAQIIRMMLFSAAVQAAGLEGAAPGWCDLDRDFQARILALMQEDLTAKGLSLMEPDFMKTPPVGGEAFVAAMAAKSRGHAAQQALTERP